MEPLSVPSGQFVAPVSDDNLAERIGQAARAGG
jgi:hypothetical protein